MPPVNARGPPPGEKRERGRGPNAGEKRENERPDPGEFGESGEWRGTRFT